MAERRSIAHSFDCDGVLVWRIPFQTDAVKLKHGSFIVPDKLPALDRVVDETPVSRWDLNYRFHAIRRVTKLASRAIIAISQGDIYLNTGRENRRAYVDLTDRVLAKGGIRSRFKDLFFGVCELPTALTKIVWLDQLSEQYDLVYHYDDNPRTSLAVEKYFRERGGRNNVKSILVKDWSTDFLTRDVNPQDRPNLIVARNILEAVRLAKA